jgi:aspartate-semialdehyde dehydrogenase
MENKEIKSFIKDKDVSDIAKDLFTEARLWLKIHLDEKHDVTGESIKDFILSNNDIDSVNEYFIEDKLDDYLEEDLWGGVCEQYALAKRFNINVITFIPTRHSFSREDKKYHIEVSKIVTKTTRYKLSSCCFRNSHLEKNLQQLRIGFQDFDKTEINNTVFLLLFIRDSSHYNHLYLK